MSKITKDSTPAERICAALEYVVWRGVDGQCDVTKVAGDAKSEIERLTTEVENLQYANDFCGRTIERLTAEVNGRDAALKEIADTVSYKSLEHLSTPTQDYLIKVCVSGRRVLPAAQEPDNFTGDELDADSRRKDRKAFEDYYYEDNAPVNSGRCTCGPGEWEITQGCPMHDPLARHGAPAESGQEDAKRISKLEDCASDHLTDALLSYDFVGMRPDEKQIEIWERITRAQIL